MTAACPLCHKAACLCRCYLPYPSKPQDHGARLYTRALFEQDMLSIGKIRTEFHRLLIEGALDGFKHLAAMSVCNDMEKACKGRLAFTRELLTGNDLRRERKARTNAPVSKDGIRLPSGGQT